MKYWLTVRLDDGSGDLAWIRYCVRPNIINKGWIEISEITFNFLMNFIIETQDYYKNCWVLLK